ncbi:hypothetical protein R1sor_007505 [Riccia sorocarpa]|uniref:Uncharacterized protein n=1 Tax=Riccia sorocarpa TaxID=122646 RepID=A0ABD3HU28_9MARC
MAGITKEGDGKFANVRGCVLLDMLKPLSTLMKVILNGEKTVSKRRRQTPRLEWRSILQLKSEDRPVPDLNKTPGNHATQTTTEGRTLGKKERKKAKKKEAQQRKKQVEESAGETEGTETLSQIGESDKDLSDEQDSDSDDDSHKGFWRTNEDLAGAGENAEGGQELEDSRGVQASG